jgi:hypothetical protein
MLKVIIAVDEIMQSETPPPEPDVRDLLASPATCCVESARYVRVL